MAGATLNLNWKAPGPVSLAFVTDVMPVSPWVKGLMGPQGSGKTQTALWAAVRAAFAMNRSPIDGRRRFRHLVIRETYRQLETTTIPSWQERFPKSVGTWHNSQPYKHDITFMHPNDGGLIDFEVMFVGIGEADIEAVLRGFQPTWITLEEADLLPPELLTFAIGRVGRYPPAEHGGAPYRGVQLVYNAPDTENYLYKLFEEDRPPNARLYRQPSGLSARAENLAHLPAGNYQGQAALNASKKWWIRRFIDAEYGYSRDGLPVYEDEYSDDVHVSPVSLVRVRQVPLVIGLDAGRTPAAALGQVVPNGQWQTLAELVTPKDKKWGPTTFAEALNDLLARRFPGEDPRLIKGGADPASAFGGDDKDPAWLTIVAGLTGITFQAAFSNAKTPRIEVVSRALTRRIDARTPGYILDPSCITIRKGFNSHYRHKRVKTIGPGGEQISDEIDKNHESHVMEAKQYAMLVGTDYSSLVHRRLTHDSGSMGNQTYAISDAMPDGEWA